MSLSTNPQSPTSTTANAAMSERDRLSFLRRKVELEVQIGLNVQPDQPVLIRAETGFKQYVDLIAEQCRARGCGRIDIEWDDPLQERELLLTATEEEIARIRPEVLGIYERWIADGGARINIFSEEFPNILDGTDPSKRAILERRHHLERAPYYYEVATKDLSQWCLVAVATDGWAAEVFPDESATTRLDRLNRAIATCLRLDAEDPVAAWKDHLRTLGQRAKLLNQLELRALRFQGPGTDLKVRLSPLSRFVGGEKSAKNGAPFIPNLPTEEVFTTPDWRGTQGTVSLTRPVILNGTLITGLRLHFRDGILVDSSADRGHEAFLAFAATDDGARRLGEVALVGTDSRVFQTGVIFRNMLFDENAASHIALGDGYKKCLEGGVTMSAEELAQVGCNTSDLHDDLMISNQHTDVTGTTKAGLEMPLLRAGAWVI